MESHVNNRGPSVPISAPIKTGLKLLLQAFEYSQLTSEDRWIFAVEIKQLTELGLSPNDLRLLVRMKLVEHAREVTAPGDNVREFRPSGELCFTGTSCFVFTTDGVVWARGVVSADSNDGDFFPLPTVGVEESKTSGSLTPAWNPETRELRFANKLVKRYKCQAVNQETVLAAFEEEGWPPRIDDPLPPKSEQDSKQRLHDTIKWLNRRQQNRLIHFRGDGTGEGVRWEHVTERNGQRTSHGEGMPPEP